MHKSTKGALAASAAGVLLLGGAGSLAYWTADTTVDGGTIASGHLKLSAASCPSGWVLDGGTPYVAQQLVPGDTLTEVCTFEVDASGSHLTADLDAATPSLTGAAALVDELVVTATYKVNGVATGSTDVPIADGDTIEATIAVDWPLGVEDNDSNVATGLSAVLADITIVATQGHAA